MSCFEGELRRVRSDSLSDSEEDVRYVGERHDRAGFDIRDVQPEVAGRRAEENLLHELRGLLREVALEQIATEDRRERFHDSLLPTAR